MGQLIVPPQNIVPCTSRTYGLGSLANGEAFDIHDSDLNHHGVVLGGTGSGKSKFLEALMRGFTKSGRGFCFIDPHGDTSEDLLAYIAYQKRIKKNDALLQRVHYLEPSYEMVFGYDPFKFQPLHHIADDRREAAYESWLQTKADRVSEILQRKQNQFGFEGMPTLQRVLRDVLYATGRAVDEFGQHLPFSEALVLLDIYHKRHMDVFNRVAPFLDADIASDFHFLHQIRSVRDLRQETGSTVNRLRSFLGPVVKGIFAATVHTIDFHQIMQRGEILLVNLRETDYFSADQANALGGLFIHEILTNAARMPRECRRAFSLIIDEVGEYIGQDLMRALGAVRKYELSLVLAGQDLTTFQKKDIDLAPKVLSQCGTVICFQQTYKKDLEILVDRLGRGNLSFEELYQVTDRPDGYELLDMEDFSEGFTWQDNWSEGGSEANGETITETKSRQRSLQETWSHGQAHQESQTQSHSENRGDVETQGKTEGKATGRGRVQRPVMHGDDVYKHIPVVSENEQQNESEHASRASSVGSADNVGSGSADTETDTIGGGITEAEGKGSARGSSLTHASNYTNGGAYGRSIGRTRRKQVIQKTREEWHPTGKLRRSVADQFEMMMTQMYQLGVAECFVKLKSKKMADFVRVIEVKEMWAPQNKFKQIARIIEELRKLHAYFVPPAIGNAAQEERIDAYVGKKLPDGGTKNGHTNGVNGHQNGVNAKPKSHNGVNGRNGKPSSCVDEDPDSPV